MARYIEYHGETDSRDSSSQHVFIIGVMGNHGQVVDKIVDATKLDGKGYAESHGKKHKQRVGGSGDTHLGKA